MKMNYSVRILNTHSIDLERKGLASHTHTAVSNTGLPSLLKFHAYFVTSKKYIFIHTI